MVRSISLANGGMLEINTDFSITLLFYRVHFTGCWIGITSQIGHGCAMTRARAGLQCPLGDFWKVFVRQDVCTPINYHMYKDIKIIIRFSVANLVLGVFKDF